MGNQEGWRHDIGDKMGKITTLGADISLNHGALVVLVNGELDNFFYYTDKAGSAARHDNGYRIPPNVFKGDKQTVQVNRLEWVKKFIYAIVKNIKPNYSALEDYALRAEQGAHQLGEVGGITRMTFRELGCSFRLHDPVTAKMFITHDGTAQKDLVERCIFKRFGVDYGNCNQPLAKPTASRPNPKPNRVTSEDLADAHALSYMAWVEWQLRTGKIKMGDLHEKEIRVFNRVTKTYPTCLLNREWL